ncbi:MAG: slipin family protein [Myxococcota bacterium]
MTFGLAWLPVVLIVLLGALLGSMIRVVREYERAVVFRLGRVIPLKGPGLVLLIPGIDRMERVSLRVVAHDVPKQDVITRDNVSIAVSAVVYFRVIDPLRSILAVEDYFVATSQLAQTTLRSVVGQAELDELLAERDKINLRIQQILDVHTEPWGIKVTQVEVKHIDLPVEMQRAMARQAEAERERRAKVISAEGEFQASEKLAAASLVLAQSPSALQLRYLQTLIEVASDQNSTILFPLPIELLTPFLKK